MRERSDPSVDRIKKKLVMVGDGGAGKSALLMVQSGLPFPEVQSALNQGLCADYFRELHHSDEIGR